MTLCEYKKRYQKLSKAFSLRMDQDVEQGIRRIADKEDRTINVEINRRLRRTLDQDGLLTVPGSVAQSDFDSHPSAVTQE
jgi:hypothetical protein